MIGSLFSATMAAAFIFFPFVMLLGACIFVVARLRRASRRHTDLKKEWALSRVAIRDPVTVGVLLVVSGVVVVTFVTGRISLVDYSDLLADAFNAYGRALTDWDDPLSSESISFRGGVLILFISAAIVAYALLGHFRTKWKAADRVLATDRLR